MILDDLKIAVSGQWYSVLSALGIDSRTLSNKHCPCPICGGDDRFRFDDLGAGRWLCSGGRDKRGCNTSGDGFGLIMGVRNISFGDACKLVEAHLGVSSAYVPIKKEKLEPIDWTNDAILELDSGVIQAYSCEKQKRFSTKPSQVYRYRDESGKILFAVLRVERDGKKQTLPVCYTKEHGITFQGYTKPRPPYNLHLLDPLSNTLIVEGEKCADYALKALPDWNIVTWCGGTNQINKTTWPNFLNSAPIYIWPDNDTAGFDAAKELKSIYPHASILSIPSDKPKGWDIADAIEEGANVLDFILTPPKNVLDYMAQVDTSIFHDITKKGKPKPTIENVEAMFLNYGITANFDVIQKKSNFAIPWREYANGNEKNATYTEIISLCTRNDIPSGTVRDIADTIAYRTEINPIKEWIASNPWDGFDRITELCNTLPVDNPELSYKLVRMWLIGAVAMACDDRPKTMQGILVLKGAQGCGKTTWLKNLLPIHMRDYLKDSIELDPSNKDSLMQCIQYWIVELGELGSTMRKDQDRLKAFITADSDEFRRPYKHESVRYPRRTALSASINDNDFLKDETGSRRFWVLDITGQIAFHAINMQQVYAQALYAHKSGESYYMDNAMIEELGKSNERFVEVDPVEDLIQNRLDWQAPEYNWKRTTATELMRDLGINEPKISQKRRCTSQLRKKGCEESRTEDARLFLVPPIRESLGF